MRNAQGWGRALCVVLVSTACSFCAADDPASIDESELSDVTVSPTSAPADGATLVQITATITKPHSSSLPSVHVSTSAGVFVPANANATFVPVDRDGVATALLRTPREAGRADIRTSGRTTQIVRQIIYTPAPPDTAVLETSAVTIKANTAAELTVTARLTRRTGFVTPGYVVTFYDSVPGAQRQLGNFSSSTLSGADGVVTARYAPGISAACGRMVLVAVVNAPRPLIATTAIEVLRVKGDTILACGT